MARIGKFFFFDGSENLATVLYYHVRSNGGVVESIGCVDNTSSFLEQSSFLLSPSGYKEDTVYTQKPIGATGNLTFTRGSDSWRTNVQGLVERTPYNLLQYSEDFINSYWLKTSMDVFVNTVTAPNGTLTADTVVVNAAGVQQNIRTFFPITFNTGVYTLSIYAKKNNINFIYMELGNSYATFDLSTGVLSTSGQYSTGWTFTSASSQALGDGWFRFVITSNCTISGNYVVRAFHPMSIPNNFTYPTVGHSSYIWGAQVNEGAYPLEYFPTTDRLDVPRIDYSYGTCPALLLEPQRTNIVLYSEQFDDVSWTKNASTLTPNTTVSPNGNLNADTLSVTTTTYSGVYRTVSGTSAIYTVSVYAKKNTKDWLFLVDVQGTGGRAWFNLNTGVLGTVVSGYTATITNVGNGWYRCTLTNTTAQSAIYHQLGLSDADNTLTPISAGSAFIWGAQLEAGAYPSSYIRTEATTVTRLADSFSRNNIYTNNLITSAGGTWYVELRGNLALTPDTSGQGISLGDNITPTSGNQLQIRSLNTSSRIILSKRVAGTFTSLYTTTTNTCKIIFKWDGSTLDIFENGVKVITATPFTATALEFFTVSNLDAPKYIQAMALYPVPLDDVDCELLTNPTSSGYSSFASMASSLGYILI